MKEDAPFEEQDLVWHLEGDKIQTDLVRNELVAPFEAPFLKKEIPVGITPQEQRGIGIPNRDALSEDLKSHTAISHSH